MSQNIQEQIKSLLGLTAGKISDVTDLKFDKEGEQFRVTFMTKNPTIFLENSNQVLNAIQHFIRKVIHLKNPDDHSHFFFDIGYHNKNREYILSVKIPELAQETIITQGKPVILVGLNSFERLYVHNILADVNGLQTTSVGIDPNRKLLILPTSETGSTALDDSIVFDINTIKNDNNIDMFKHSTELTSLEKLETNTKLD
jgi:predicted RNA-binding protein Jag